MAKVGRPLNSEKARGAIGGIIFSESNKINYVRKNTRPKYELTENRKMVATRLANAASGWQAMTAREREAWEIFAESNYAEDAFGQKFKKPAFSWYVGCRENLASCLINRLPDVPTSIPSPPSGLTATRTLTPSGSNLRIQDVPTNADRDLRLRLYISKEKSPSRIFNFSECALWRPTSSLWQGNVYAFPGTSYDDFKGVYTIYVQYVNSVSGVASPMVRFRHEFV